MALNKIPGVAVQSFEAWKERTNDDEATDKVGHSGRNIGRGSDGSSRRRSLVSQHHLGDRRPRPSRGSPSTCRGNPSCLPPTGRGPSGDGGPGRPSPSGRRRDSADQAHAPLHTAPQAGSETPRVLVCPAGHRRAGRAPLAGYLAMASRTRTPLKQHLVSTTKKGAPMHPDSTASQSEAHSPSRSAQRPRRRNGVRRVALRSPVQKSSRRFFPPTEPSWCQLEELRPWHPVGIGRWT